MRDIDLPNVPKSDYTGSGELRHELAKAVTYAEMYPGSRATLLALVTAAQTALAALAPAP